MTSPHDRRKELKRAYKERVTPAGVFKIENTVSGKLLLGSSLNLDGVLNRHRFNLANGAHTNTALQRDWKQHGADAFHFEILEVVDVREEPGFDLDDELTLLELLWLEKLGPLGERTYNRGDNLRQV